jgi:hypothetical protein
MDGGIETLAENEGRVTEYWYKATLEKLNGQRTPMEPSVLQKYRMCDGVSTVYACSTYLSIVCKMIKFKYSIVLRGIETLLAISIDSSGIEWVDKYWHRGKVV